MTRTDVAVANVASHSGLHLRFLALYNPVTKRIPTRLRPKQALTTISNPQQIYLACRVPAHDSRVGTAGWDVEVQDAKQVNDKFNTFGSQGELH